MTTPDSQSTVCVHKPQIMQPECAIALALAIYVVIAIAFAFAIVITFRLTKGPPSWTLRHSSGCPTGPWPLGSHSWAGVGA